MGKIILNSEKEYEEYKSKFINKWKPIFKNSLDKNKTYQSNKTQIFNDFLPLGEYAIHSMFYKKTKNFANIKELKI